MKTTLAILTFALSAALMVGCGGDDGGGTKDTGRKDTGGTDTGGDTGPVCDPTAGGMGACNYTKDNSGDKDNAEFRLIEIAFTKPPTFAAANATVNGVIDDGEFNWLVTLDVSNNQLKTGPGKASADCAMFSYYAGDATDGDANRYDPTTISGTYSGDTFSSPGGTGGFTLPLVIGTDKMITDMPVENPVVDMVEWDADGNCVGAVGDTSKGSLTAYLTIAGTMPVNFDLAGTQTNLCTFISQGDCTMTADTFGYKPGFKCESGTCAACTPTAGKS